jgi:signal transduction histidine kinase
LISALAIVRKKIESNPIEGLQRVVDRGERNLQRLVALEAKISDIVRQKSVEEKEGILTLVSSAFDLVEDLREESSPAFKEVMGRISNRLNSLFSMEEINIEEIALGAFLDTLCDEVESKMRKRELTIVRNFENRIRLHMDGLVLEKACIGLLKNAIENTPDEGKIEIAAWDSGREIGIDFHDYGVGITPENQKLIFGGFFHTLDTELYSSKKPYDFNAGGTGSDLLRIKVLSERLDFTVGFSSKRCEFLRTDKDLCPGRISMCDFVPNQSECYKTGHSTFSLHFRAEGWAHIP